VSSTAPLRTSPRLIGVLPAAGHAVRLQPLTGSKETYPIGGRPVMDHLIERMKRAGCTDVRVVTRPEKTDVIANAERHGLIVVVDHPSSVSESLLAGLRETRPDDLLLFGFPDTVWEPIDGFVRLLDALADRFDVALGLFMSGELERSDVVKLAEAGIVTSIEVKPRVPASDWIWGCAAARRHALDALSTHPEPGAVFHAMCARRRVVGVPLTGPFIDIGTPEGLQAAARGLGS
jgi:glucose-1-phosphate thymidylyltransferase